MSRRRLHPPPAPDAAPPRFRVQLALPRGAEHLPVTGELRLGPEGPVQGEGGGEAAVALTLHDGQVLARPLREGVGARLNEVQLAGPASLRPGDQLAVGACRATLLRDSPPAAGPQVHPPALLEPWLEDAVARAARRGESLGLAELPPWADAVAPGEEGALFALAAGTRLWVGGGAPPVGALHLSRFPEDATHAPALLARTLGAGAPEEDGEREPVVRETVMVRLAGLLEHLAGLRVPVLLEGEPGVGRALWGRRLLALMGAGPVEVVAGAAPHAPGRLQEVARRQEEEGRLASPRVLLVEEVDWLPPAAQEGLAALAANGLRGGALVGTAQRAETLVPALAACFAQGRVLVPPLRDRPAEVPALVEAELARLRVHLGRPALQLDGPARALVLADGWPGNVDALRAGLWRAARLAVGDSVRLEDLPLRLREGAARLGVAAARAAAEKSALVAALLEAGWNVSETARRLGVPRRTLVHRMAVLGVRRPGSR